MKSRDLKKLTLAAYIVILIAYPLMRAGQGLYVADTTYSPGNFVFFPEMSGTWTIATFLANLLGYVITCLPYGSTLFGLNIYTSLIVSFISVAVLVFLKDHISMHILFIGELLALGLCWCPTTILYNYLTYLLFTLAVLFMFRALCGGNERGFIIAGILLGMNVLTRLPNVTEAVMIVAVWFAGAISHTEIKKIVKQTLMCIAGYIVGFAAIWWIICVRYSPGAYVDMIRHMFMMTDLAVDYKPVSMIGAMFADYLYAGRWILFWLAATVFVMVAFRFCKRTVATALAVCAFGLVIRVCYGQGMFSFRYYEYSSIYFWAVIMLFFVTIICAAVVACPRPVWSSEDEYKHKRILSLIVLVMIYVTCIGSNNGLYPAVNNMFITAPYVIWMIADAIRWLFARGAVPEKVDTVPEKVDTVPSDDKKPSMLRPVISGTVLTVTILCVCTLIQSFGFHLKFAFNDGVDGAPRDSYVSGYERTAHIKTTAYNARTLSGLMDYIYADKQESDTVILYGEVSGLGYLLGLPSALTTFWPQLDSYNYEEWTTDIRQVYDGMHPCPYIIIPPQLMTEGISEISDDPKLNDLIQIIRSYGYELVYSNEAYEVYSTK